MKRFQYNLACRFVKDFNFPVSIITDVDIFYYELGLYNDDFGTLDKWESLWNMLDRKYPYKTDETRAQLFLDEYAAVRDKIITTLEKSDKYIEFNNSKELLDKYRIDNKIPATSTKSAYNQLHIGKRFVSVDMKNANFQALKYAGVIDDMSYRDFIAQFASGEVADYISESKYTRQVIFGKLNPKRQIAVEKYLMSKILNDYFLKDYAIADDFKLVYFGSDEFVFEETKWTPDVVTQQIIDNVKRDLNIDIRVEPYELTGYEFFVRHSDETKHKLGEFYRRSCDKPGKMKCVPLPYHKIIYKLMTGGEVIDYDEILMYEKCTVCLIDEIEIEKVKNGTVEDI